MKIANIANLEVGPITTMPWYPAAQPMSEGSFMQTLQDTVNGVMDGTASPGVTMEQPSYTEQGFKSQGNVQSRQPQDSTQNVQPQDGAQDVQLQDNAQSLQPQDAQLQDTVQVIQPEEQEALQSGQETDVQQPDMQEKPQQEPQVLQPEIQLPQADLTESLQDVQQEDAKAVQPETKPAQPDLAESEQEELQPVQPEQPDLPESRQDVQQEAPKTVQPEMQAAQTEKRKTEQSAAQENAQYIPQSNAQTAPAENTESAQPEAGADEALSKVQPMPQLNASEDTVRYAPRREGAVYPLPIDGIVQDPELMKELADLMQQTQKMLAAPEEMKAKLEELIAQAFEELNDPEKQQEEFEEDILEFLLEFIDRKFGGEREETSPLAGSDKDETDVRDVLLQAVVDMLDNVRSEDAEAPEETDQDVPEAGHIPKSHMAKEYVRAGRADNLIDEGRPYVSEKQSFADVAILYEKATRPLHRAEYTRGMIGAEQREIPKQEGIIRYPVREEKAVQTIAQEQAVAQTLTQQSEYYQATAQAAENIYNALTGTQNTEVQNVQPNIRNAQTVQPVQPANTERSTDNAPIASIKPADELAELTRLVRTGDSAKSEQPDFTDHGERPDSSGLTVKLTDVPEAVPFEAAIATASSEQVLTASFADQGTSVQQVVTQIASEIFNQLPENGGATTFVMTLNPESLGRVTVKLVEEAGRISVSVTAHSRQTAELLSARFENLQAAMKENGTQLEKYQVVYAPEEEQRSGQQNYDGSSKNPYVRQDREESENDADSEFAELLQQAV